MRSEQEPGEIAYLCCPYEARPSFDGLTQLPSRRALFGRLSRRRENKQNRPASLILVGIDRFGRVNHTFGRSAGDDLLIQVSRRLVELADFHLVVRLGGDEFAIFCEESSAESAQRLAKGVVEGFRYPLLLDGRPFRCTVSVGIAPVIDADGGDRSISEALHAADSAMASAKRLGGDQVAVFGSSTRGELLRRIHLEQDLFQAIERGEMKVHFQAQISVTGDHLLGFEALLRWRHPVYSDISPEEFIPIAEQTGHMQAIGAWVLRQSLHQIGAWRARYMPRLFVSVNVSVQQLAAQDFVDVVRGALEESGLPSEALQLEMTESLLLQSAAEHQLQAIQLMGVRVAIDDFGTGYSSLSYLQRLAVSELKMDRTFLEDVGKNERKTVLFGAIVRMAHALDMVVVAEGVEDSAQLECIRRCLCDRAQGYLLSRPIPPEAVESMLRKEWKSGILRADSKAG